MTDHPGGDSTADGPDEQEALEALTRLVERGFDEMSCA